MHNCIDDDQLKKLAPSIFASRRSNCTSEKYGFIPTIECIRGLKQEGFMPVSVSQSRTRLEERKGFAKHMVRLRHQNEKQVNGMIPEIILINSHDGTSSYQLRAGIYRFVCSNGLIVGNDQYCRRIRHHGNIVDEVVKSANVLLEIFPQSVDMANKWQRIYLNPRQKQAYAEAASVLKWDNEKILIDPLHLLQPKRRDDEKNDVWTTFNVIQENLIRGGVKYKTESGQRQRTRGAKSIGENTRLNVALWMLTEKLTQIVS